MRKCCGTCRWHRHEDISDDWVCANGESDYCTDWTDYDHCCEDWERRVKNEVSDEKKQDK